MSLWYLNNDNSDEFNEEFFYAYQNKDILNAHPS